MKCRERKHKTKSKTKRMARRRQRDTDGREGRQSGRTETEGWGGS